MSDIGHGRYGLRSGLQPFKRYQNESARRKDVFVRMTSAQVLNSSWFYPGSGAVYSHTWDKSFDGRTLDVVGVRLVDEVLTRVDTTTELAAEESTYRYARDPGGTLQLSVHLAGGASPSSRNVLIVSSWFDATGAAKREHLVHPTTGRQRFLNHDLDLWSGSPATPDDWTFLNTGGGGAAEVRQAAGIGDGTTYSANIHGNGSAVDGRIRQTVTIAAPPSDVGPYGYRLWCSYLTPKTILASQGARVRITDAGSPETAIYSDGRSLDSGSPGSGYGEHELEKTFGKPCLLCFDFIGHTSPLTFDLIGYSTSANPFDVYFGRASLEKIHGWDWYAPRIAPGGAPEIFEGSSDPFPGSESTGAGAITVLNDGTAAMERRFSYPWLWPSRDVEVLLGGSFLGGQEILYFDMHRAFRGVINGDNSPRVGPRSATVSVESYRQLFEATLPPRKYGVDWPDVAAADRNRPRPIVFGSRPHTRPAGVSYVPGSPATGYRVYELCDTTDWAAGIGGATAVKAYRDEESADKDVGGVTLTALLDYTQDQAAGTLSIIHNVRVLEITSANDKIDFVAAGVTLEASIPHGPYILGDGHNTVTTAHRGLLDALRIAMETASGAAGWKCVYDETTHKVTINWNGMGTGTLLCDTGLNRANSIYPTLGFDSAADMTVTGGTGGEASAALFSSADADHVIRAAVDGFADPTGRFTGIVTSPPSLIVLLADIFRFILEVFLAQPAERYNLAEWEDARTACPQTLGIYLGGLGDQPPTMKISDVIDWMENGSATSGEGPAEIRLDGNGVFRFLKRTSTVPDDAPHIREHDLLELIDGGFMPSQAARFVEVRFDRDASTGKTRSVRTDNEFTRLAFQNDREAVYETFLTDADDAADVNAALVALHRAPIRQFTAVSKSKVIESLKGDIVLMTVSQALLGAADVGPGLDGAAFRIQSKKLDPETQRVTLVLFTNIIT